MANHSSSNYPDIGTLGEDLTAKWLLSQGWQILQKQWHSRWGEIDIIAEHLQPEQIGSKSKLPILAFVEVKTRGQNSWDSEGRNAIAYPKQIKIYRTAHRFLSQHAEKAEYACRFDVAIVGYRFFNQDFPFLNSTDVPERVLASTSVNNYYLFLKEYICSAFDSPE